MLRRGLAFSPGDGGGGDGGEGGAGADGASAAPKGGKGPDPIPYDVFKATNDKLRTAEKRAEAAEKKLSGFDGWKAPEEVETLLAAERTKGERLLLLADNGVDPRYRTYVAGRLDQEKPEDPAMFLAELRKTEGAFFTGFGGQPAPSMEPGNKETKQPRTPPKSNPDGKGAGSSAPGDGRAVTAADIDAMTVPEYLAWKKAGGLERVREQGA